MRQVKSIAFIIFSFLFFFLCDRVSSLAQGEPVRVERMIAVLDLGMGDGVKKTLTTPITNALINELVGLRVYDVIDRANRDRILSEQGFQLTDCVEEECRVKAGELLGVGKIVVGNVSKVGKVFFITVQMINVETGMVEGAAMDKCAGTIDELLDLMSSLAAKLAGVEVKAPSRRRIETKTKTIGSLNITSEPSGAKVFLDGKSAGTAPTVLRNIEPGQHKIRLEKEDCLPYEKTVRVRTSEISVKAKLKGLKGSLNITSEPSGARIFLDGKSVGTAPTVLRNIEPGQHKIRLEKKGCLPYEKTMRVSNREILVKARLKRLGILNVSGKPAGAQISLDGSVVGSSPQDIKVSPGIHTIKVTKSGYKQYTKRLRVMEGKSYRIDYNLLKEK